LADNDEIVLCEGEWDRIINEQNGIPTATTTAGAGAFQLEWAKHFRDKHVFICYDEDQAGIDGALRTAKMLKDVAAGVYIMTNLGTGLKGGDLTDYWVAGSTEAQFRSLMDEARKCGGSRHPHHRPTRQRGALAGLLVARASGTPRHHLWKTGSALWGSA
jgi:hypothetical protein